MHEVRLSKPYKKGADVLSYINIIDYEQKMVITTWYKEELAWCSDRDIEVSARLEFDNYTAPNAKQLHSILKEGLVWDGVPTVFRFHRESDATLFRLTWG